MGQGFLCRGLPAECRLDLPGSFSQEKASDLRGILPAGFQRTAKAFVEDEPKGGFTDQVFDPLPGQDYAPRRPHLNLNREVMSPVSFESQPHPPAENRPVHHLCQEIPEGPEKGDGSDLPDGTTHDHLKGKFEFRSTKSETKTDVPKLANSQVQDKLIISCP
jgi:hypothetical protein